MPWLCGGVVVVWWWCLVGGDAAGGESSDWLWLWWCGGGYGGDDGGGGGDRVVITDIGGDVGGPLDASIGRCFRRETIKQSNPHQYHTTFCNTIPHTKLIKNVVNTTAIPVKYQH